MSVVFITYLWHYMTARALYDAFLGPLLSGHPGPSISLVLIAVGAFLLGRRSAMKGRP